MISPMAIIIVVVLIVNACLLIALLFLRAGKRRSENNPPRGESETQREDLFRNMADSAPVMIWIAGAD